MNADQMTAFRSIARAATAARQAGDDNWIPADVDTKVCILNELHRQGLIDDNGRVTDQGRQAFAWASV